MDSPFLTILYVTCTAHVLTEEKGKKKTPRYCLSREEGKQLNDLKWMDGSSDESGLPCFLKTPSMNESSDELLLGGGLSYQQRCISVSCPMNLGRLEHPLCCVNSSYVGECGQFVIKCHQYLIILLFHLGKVVTSILCCLVSIHVYIWMLV